MRHAIIIYASVALLLGAGCSDGDAVPTAEFETEGWIGTGPPGPPSQRPGEDGGFEGEEEEDEEEDDEGEGGFFAACAIFGSWDGSTFSDPEGEVFVENGGQDLCIMSFEVTINGPADGCPDCTVSWEFQFSNPEAEVDVDGACATYGPGQIDGMTMRLGLTAENVMMIDEGGAGWNPFGEAIQEEEGELVLEWEHEGE